MFAFQKNAGMPNLYPLLIAFAPGKLTCGRTTPRAGLSESASNQRGFAILTTTKPYDFQQK